MARSWLRSLKLKLPVLVFVVFLVLAAGFMRTIQTIVVSEFTSIEHESALRDVERAQAALDLLCRQAESVVGDWGPWDETYVFMTSHSQEYVASNLNRDTLANLEVDRMVFLEPDLGVHHAAGFDPVTGRPTELSPEDAGALRKVAALLDRDGPGDSVQGLAALRDGPAVVAAQWIVPSLTEAAPNGVIVVVRYLLDEEVATVAKVTQLRIELASPDRRDTLRPRIPAFAREHPGVAYAASVDRGSIVGWSTLRGLDGKPAAVVAVIDKRMAYTYAMRTLNMVGWGITAFVLLFAAGMHVAIDRTVMRRLTHLHRQVTSLHAAERGLRKVDVVGSDELSDLAGAINSTLDQLGHAEGALQDAADHDYLTGLKNRRRLAEDAERELSERQRVGGHCALILVDLNDFKLVNDTHGHPAGDAVLIWFAETLRDTVRAYSTIARIGGDEFAVLLPHAGSEEARAVMARLDKRLAEDSATVGDIAVPVSATMAFAISPEDGEDLEELSLAADQRLYDFK